MKILLIYSVRDYQSPAKPIRDPKYIYFGISYISSYLKSHGHQTELLILTRVTKKSIIDQFITQFQPSLICFTAVTTEYAFISKIANYVKSSYPSIFLLIGGIYSSINPERVIQGPFDALCIGEGEYPTLELVEYLEKGKKPRKIKNLWIKTEEGIEKNPTREFNQDLDSLPFPDREMWHKWTHYRDIGDQNILLGRGCPFNCTYCYNHALKKVANGKYVRFRSANNILLEIKELVTKYPKTKEIYFEGDNVGADLGFALKLCSEIQKINRNRHLLFGVNLRVVPNRDYEEIFQAFKKANFRVNIGLESGSEKIRKNILRRHYSNADIIRTIKQAKKYGLYVKTFNMIGLPGETLADFKKTIQVNRASLPDQMFLNMFCPYPGMDIFKIAKKMGSLPSKLDPRRQYSRPNLTLKGFSRKEIQREYQWFYFNVYRNYKPLYMLLGAVLMYKIMSSPLLFRMHNNLDNKPFFRSVKSILTQTFRFR
ncbi:MAG: B12-binding domain-containing radical SAM protein [Candidatus Heimdallarchaeota archaeon]